MSTADPFLVLGVEPGADAAAIHRAYRKLAWRHHPDRGGSAARMRELNIAFAQLRAAAGDRLASDPRGRPGPGPAEHPSPGSRAATTRERSPTFALSRRRARLRLAGTSLGQRLVTVALGLAVHAVAAWSAPPGSQPLGLEGLACVFALRLQASWTPAGRGFAPSRDIRAIALLVLRAIGWTARALVTRETRAAGPLRT